LQTTLSFFLVFANIIPYDGGDIASVHTDTLYDHYHPAYGSTSRGSTEPYLVAGEDLASTKKILVNSKTIGLAVDAYQNKDKTKFGIETASVWLAVSFVITF